MLAIAVERDLLADLHRAAAVCRLRLASVRPWWTLACNVVCRRAADSAALIALEDDALTVLTAVDSKWAAATTFAPTPDAQAARALELRLMTSAGIDAADLVRAAWGGGSQGQRWPCIGWQSAGAV